MNHVHDRTGRAVERRLAGRRLGRSIDEAQIPICLDETDGRGLVREVVIDEVGLRPRRDHQVRETRTEAATALERSRSRRLGAALTVAVEEIELRGGRVNSRPELMIHTS